MIGIALLFVSFTYPILTFSPQLSISNAFADNCQEVTSNNFTSTWQLSIESTVADANINYQRNSEPILNHTFTGTTDTVQFANVPADGGLYDTLKIWLTSNPTDGDTLIIPRPLGCSTCSCREYIYLNERTGGGAVHKYEVRPDTLMEIGSPWLDNSALGETMTNPHGLGMDLNGRLYIGETGAGDIRQLKCDGELIPAATYEIDDGGYNIGTIDNTLYINSKDRNPNAIYAYDLCTRNAIGYICLEDIVSIDYQDWGFYIAPDETFYVTDNFVSSQANHLWKFKLDTVTLNTIGSSPTNCVAPFLSEGDGTLVVGEKELPRFSLYGVVTDANDNIYIIEKARTQDPGFSGAGLSERASRLLKYRSDGTFVSASPFDNNDGDGGYFNAIGIVYSKTSNLLYVSTESPNDDCVAIFDTTLQYLGAAVPATGTSSTVKGISIATECCPMQSNFTIDTTLCGADVIGDTIFLQRLINCEGTICEGEWQVGSNTGLTYNPCNNTVIIDSLNACGTFTLSSDGVGGNLQCGNFDLTINIEVEDITNNTISSKQTVCYGSAAAPLVTTATSTSSDLTYQWQNSTTSCATDFTDIAGATNAEFSPGVITELAYYRLITTANGSCSSGLCRDTSNCVTINTVCCLEIINAVSTNCQEVSANNFTANWELTIQGGSKTDNALSYQKNSESIQNLTLSGAINQATFANIPADGTGADTLKIWMTNNPTCRDTIILPRPLPCPNTLESNQKCYENIALNQTATATPINFGTAIGDANDGNTDGIFSNGSVYHSQQAVNPFWQVDLGSLQTIDSIEIWNRTDACCTMGLNGAIVDILDNNDVVIFTDTIDTVGPNIGFPIASLMGQKVRLRKNTNGSNASLVFAEMRVLQASNCPLKTAEICNTLGASQIGGTIFQDLNFDGVMNEHDTVGLQGILVEAYDCDNNLVGTAFTDANGNYRIDKMALGETYRIEFSLPTAIDNWANPTLAGVDNGTTVQFIQAGNCANLGVANPADYCQSNPTLFIPCYEAGTGFGTNSSNAALISFPSTESGDNPTKTTELTIGDIGSVWGVGVDRQSDRVFMSTVLKRAIGMGEGANVNETGFVYFQDRSSSTPTFNKFNLQGVVPSNSSDIVSGGTIDLGSLTRNRVTGGISGDFDISDSNNSPVRDLDAFGKAGKIAFGDMDITEDNQSLWLVNLHQGALIQIDLSATSTTLNGASPNTLSGLTKQFLISELPGIPSCGNGDGTIPYNTTDGSDGSTSAVTNVGATGVLRPWALEFFRGKGYLGVICDASISKDPDDLKAFVLSFDPNNIEAGFLEEFSFDLDLPRGSNTTASNAYIVYNWQPWYDVWDSNLMANGLSPNKQIGFAQPILSDIEFAPDGSMILGFGDRWSLQNTIGHFAPESNSNTNVYDFQPHGSIIKICKENGSYHLEGSTNCAQTFTAKGTTKRFYDTKRGDGRPYGAMGSLVIQPETGEIIVPYIDPFPPGATANMIYFSTQGIHFFDYQSGERVDWLKISGSSNLLSEKGQALGDIEKNCGFAPVEIGNYVWHDSNKNGIQDACEPTLDSVILALFDAQGAMIALDTTDSNGNYYFNEEKITAFTGSSTPVLVKDNIFHIVLFGSVSEMFSQEKLTINGTEYTLTGQDALIGTSENDDLIDSDAQLGANNLPLPFFNGLPYISTTIGDLGTVDYSLDFGFNEIPKFYDYGDLPDTGAGTSNSRNYETYDSTGGPSHLIVEGLFLGDTVDVDLDGAPHPLAKGDDEIDGFDDEDGVSILPSIDIVRGRTIRLPITVTNSTADTAYLKAWIDWNGDGDFTEETELVANFKDNKDGIFPTFMEVGVPNTAVTGDLVGLRVRLSNTPNMTPYGRVNSGEVEDYSISINCKTLNCLPATELLKKE